MPKLPIKKVTARMILDSRTNPTLEVTVETAKSKGVFGVPSGASTGSFEAFELRDGGSKFLGKGVNIAIRNVNEVIGRAIKGFDVFNQKKLDDFIINLDGTPNKKRLGANAILGVSGAVVKSAAQAKKQPVYKHVSFLHKNKKIKLPRPMFNVINGGLHADNNLDIQEFMLVPLFDSPAENVKIAAEIFLFLKKVLESRNLSINVGDEGGFSPKVESNRAGLDMIKEAVGMAGYELGKDLDLALDSSANNFFKANENQYVLSADNTSLSAERLVSLYKEWAKAYSIFSIEDGLSEEDWDGWKSMQDRLGQDLMLAGDDLFVTNKQRLQKGIDLGVANAIIIKPNQVGTISETLETVKLAQDNRYRIIASHRSGETTDDFITDFAVGIGADFLKAGSVTRGERVVKYNRLTQIESELTT